MTQRTFTLLPKDPELGWTPWAWLIYLVPFVLDPLMRKADAAAIVLTAAATVAFIALYILGFWNYGTKLLLIIAAIMLIGGISLPFNNGAAVFFIYAASFAPFVDRSSRTSFILVAIIVIVLAAEALLLGLPLMRWIWGVVFAVLVGALNHHTVNTQRINAKLRLAQHEIEQLARVAERERIARDLHDVLGHTLSLIVLKSELASKLADRDAERSRQEIRDVERISREALAQVRAAISGYRTAGLAREIEGAREALGSAEIGVSVESSNVRFTPSEEAVLAMVLKESITNVLRHSRATRCAIRIEEDTRERRLMVEDDGRGMGDSSGMGLQGMRERIEAIGGTLRIESRRGVTIIASLPHSVAERAS